MPFEEENKDSTKGKDFKESGELRLRIKFFQLEHMSWDLNGMALPGIFLASRNIVRREKQELVLRYNPIPRDFCIFSKIVQRFWTSWIVLDRKGFSWWFTMQREEHIELANVSYAFMHWLFHFIFTSVLNPSWKAYCFTLHLLSL